MTFSARLGGRQLASFLVVLALVSGCSRSSDSVKPSNGPAEEKPYVEVLMGLENYQKAMPQLTKGKKAKFKGELALAGSKGKKVVVHLAELYTGDLPAIQAADLNREFMKDRAAAEKKYNPKGEFAPEIIIEGVISELQPGQYQARLAGHEG
jgi:hypothetical protein